MPMAAIPETTSVVIDISAQLLSVQLFELRFGRGDEDLVGELLAARLDVVEPHRLDAGRGVVPDRLAVSEADLLENEDLLELDVALFDPGDLGDADHLARTAAEALLLDDDVHRRRHLL